MYRSECGGEGSEVGHYTSRHQNISSQVVVLQTEVLGSL